MSIITIQDMDMDHQEVILQVDIKKILTFTIMIQARKVMDIRQVE